jgi:prolyl-tRNA editing enzyme YbaK/EbsC (Cys-tRNA(Pro) deacylase)
MASELSPAAARVQSALHAAGLELRVTELPASTRTAVEAAVAVGCSVAQIVKSLVFRTVTSNEAVLVLASGANRVDEARIGAYLHEPIEKASADFVRLCTGFSIGGVPPVGHPAALRTIVDEDLYVLPQLWAAAGTPNAVFALTPADLRALLPEAVSLALRVQGA